MSLLCIAGNARSGQDSCKKFHERPGVRGREAANKTPFVAAVKTNAERHPEAIKLQVVDSFRSKKTIKNGLGRIRLGRIRLGRIRFSPCQER